jgi:putative transposase
MRKPRQLKEGARYHVTARVNHQEMRLDDEASKALFLDTIKRAKCKYSFAVENFTVMGNHYHLLIRPLGGESLSQIMHWIMGVFAMAYNRIHRLKGHFWQDRYYSRIVDSLRDLLDVFSYIDKNPVRAGLVDDAWAWIYGGMRHHRTGRFYLVGPPMEVLAFWFPAHQLQKLS